MGTSDEIFFSQEAYDKYDAMGRFLLSAYLEDMGYEIQHNEENRGADIHAIKGGLVHYFEVGCQASAKWTSRQDFPFPMCSFWGRKLKFTHRVLIVEICANTLAYYAHYSDVIKEHGQRVKKDIDRNRKEVRMFLPKKNCYFGQIPQNIKTLWESRLTSLEK